MIDIANLTNGCLAVYGDHSHLAGRQAQDSVLPFLGDQLRAAAGRPCQLSPFARFQLDIVNHRAQRDVRQTQAIARLDIGIAARKHRVTYGKPNRRKDVSLLAVLVVEQCDIGRAVGVVFNAGNPGRDIFFVSLEINDSKSALVPAAPMPGCYPTITVAPP
jgi:hypothetical protein